MKKALIIVGAVLALLVLGVAILLANLEKVANSKKPELLAQVEKQIGRKLTIEEIGVGVFPSIGVRLKAVTLSDDPAFSDEPFVVCENVSINVKLGPLLKKKVEIKRLVLERPVVRIIKDAFRLS